MVTATHFSELEKRRRQLGMSRQALAKRAGLSLPTVTRLLTGKDCNPRVQTVDAVAVALGVPIAFGAGAYIDAETLREQRAEQKARRLVGLVQGTMALESQAVGPEPFARMVRRTTHGLLAGSNRALWDD